MSVYYTCDIYLKAPFNEETLLILLIKGKQIGCIYFYRESYSDDFDVSKDMSSKEALNYLKIGQTVKKDDFDFPKNLAIQYQDTIFTFDFHLRDGTALHFFVLENPWKKNAILTNI